MTNSENTGSGRISWAGIRIIENATDLGRNSSVDTLEGRIGPLLKGDGSQAHFIEMPGDLYCHEHSHPTESIIFTVKGRWILCSGGHRHIMNPGSIFWFGANVPTGYENPFPDPAFLLIFKGIRDDKDDAAFLCYLKDLKERLEADHRVGVPFKISELPENHSAKIFYRSLEKAVSAR